MIGVFDDDEDLSEHSFTGRQFSEMPEAQQEALLQKKNNLVFSRAEPKHKQVRNVTWYNVLEESAVERRSCYCLTMGFCHPRLSKCCHDRMEVHVLGV
jgi:hypothetical protein